MSNAIICHGVKFKEEFDIMPKPLCASMWYPWLQQRLILAGVPTQVPSFTNSWLPARNYAADSDILSRQQIDENTILIGHSFGGKLSLLYASMYPVKKLVLFGSPFKVKKNPNSLKVKTLKKLKTLPGLKNIAEIMKKHMGSTDYRNASPMMRDILVKHVNTDITENVKKITCPTIIIWGTNDAAVPITDAYDLEKLIKDSAVIPYEGCTHYAYLERLGQTNSIIKNFIKER